MHWPDAQAAKYLHDLHRPQRGPLDICIAHGVLLLIQPLYMMQETCSRFHCKMIHMPEECLLHRLMLDARLDQGSFLDML